MDKVKMLCGTNYSVLSTERLLSMYLRYDE